jgi:hypothetical protein
MGTSRTSRSCPFVELVTRHRWLSVVSLHVISLGSYRCQAGEHSISVHISSVRFEVFTAVTMKNGVFCDIKPSSYFTGDTLRLRYRAQPVNVT